MNIYILDQSRIFIIKKNEFLSTSIHLVLSSIKVLLKNHVLLRGEFQLYV